MNEGHKISDIKTIYEYCVQCFWTNNFFFLCSVELRIRFGIGIRTYPLFKQSLQSIY